MPGIKPAKIFDEATLKIMQTAYKTAFADARKNIDKLKTAMSDLTHQIKEGEAAGRNVAELENARVKTIKELIANQKTLNEMSQKGRPGTPREFGSDKGPPTAGEQAGVVGGAAFGVAKAMPGQTGEAANVIGSTASAGVSAAALGLTGPVIAVVAALAGLAAVAGSVMDRFEEYKATIPDRLTLTGMGQTPATTGQTRAQYEVMGFDMTQAMTTQASAARAMGDIGKEQGDNRMIRIMGTARKFGMAPEQFTGAGEQMRQMGGTDLAQKNLGMMMGRMEVAVQKGMDRTQVPHLLTAQLGLLSQINKEGFLDTNALMDVVAGYARKNGGIGAEQAARQIGGLNQAVAGSSGEANAFFQMAYNSQGLGNGSLLGTQMAVRQGFQPANLGEMQKNYGGTETTNSMIKMMRELGLGNADFGKKAATGILDSLDNMYKGKDKYSMQGRTEQLNMLLGGRTAQDALKNQALLEKIKAGGTGGLTEVEKKKYADMGKAPEERWQSEVTDGLDKIALETSRVAAAVKDTRIGTGEIAAPYVNKMIVEANAVEVNLTGQGNKATPAAVIPALGANVAPSYERGNEAGMPIRPDIDWSSVVSSFKSLFSSTPAPTGAAASMQMGGKTPTPAPTQSTTPIPGGPDISDTYQNTPDVQQALLNESKEQTKYLKTMAGHRGGAPASRPTSIGRP